MGWDIGGDRVRLYREKFRTGKQIVYEDRVGRIQWMLGCAQACDMEKTAEQFELGLGGDGPVPAPPPPPSQMELFNAHMELARTIARSFKTTRNSADHDDIEQAALLALHRASEAFRPDEGREFAPYAGQAVRNALTDFYRKTRRIDAREAFSLDAQAVGTGSGEVSGEGATWKDNWADVEAEIASLAAAANESSGLLHQAITKLMPNQRLIVEAVLAGRSFVEIAEERRVSKQAVHNTYRRALVQMKIELYALGVQGFEPATADVYESQARYSGALLSSPIRGLEVDPEVDFATAVSATHETKHETNKERTSLAESPVTSSRFVWWAKVLSWWRGLWQKWN